MVYLQDSKITVHDSTQVAGVFRDLLGLDDGIDQAKEHFYVMHLDCRSRINMVELVSIGSLNCSIVHPPETFRRAVIAIGQGIVVPIGDPRALQASTVPGRPRTRPGQGTAATTRDARDRLSVAGSPGAVAPLGGSERLRIICKHPVE